MATALVGGVGTRTSQVTTSHLDVSWQPAVEGFWTRTLMVMMADFGAVKTSTRYTSSSLFSNVE